MNTPTPALVSKDAVKRLPRLPLVLLCLAYLVPGLIGRDPWKNADLTAFGYMANMARGLGSWWEPTIGGVAGPGNLLPYWIGAASIRLFGPWLGDPMAARLPFTLMLAFVLWATWTAAYSLARTEAAQPAPFAFGGEAPLVDYARAMGDAALLALIATLGLLQLGHETTPELTQLCGMGLYLLGMAIAPFRRAQSRAAILLGLPVLACSGSPSMAALLGALGAVLCLRSAYRPARDLIPWLVAATALACACATVLHLWAWRLGAEWSPGQMGRLLGWFTWPSGIVSMWTLWRWRRHATRRHIAVPGTAALLAVGASLFMGGNDRALLLGLPAMAILAAFALPTLQRSVGALIDWFSLFFFSFWALLFWVVYASLQFGLPAKPAQNVMRLLPGYAHAGSLESALAAAVALAATLGWFALAAWRAGRHRHPLWTSMVLPASGVALGWLLVMSLHLPVLDYARSYRPFLERVARQIPPGACVEVQGADALRAALESVAGYRVRPWAPLRRDGEAATPPQAPCPWGLVSISVPVEPPPQRPGWQWMARVQRPGDRNEWADLYRRQPPGRRPLSD